MFILLNRKIYHYKWDDYLLFPNGRTLDVKQITSRYKRTTVRGRRSNWLKKFLVFTIGKSFIFLYVCFKRAQVRKIWCRRLPTFFAVASHIWYCFLVPHNLLLLCTNAWPWSRFGIDGQVPYTYVKRMKTYFPNCLRKCTKK